MAAIEPDIDGFMQAQANLRQKMGAEIVWRVPVKAIWLGGTKLNPITGLPYDATAKPTNQTYREVTNTCLIILKQGSPLRPQSDTDIVALGEMSGMDIIIDIAAADYAAVEEAYEMLVNGLTYQVREAKPFSLAGTIYRYLVYGEQR